LLLQVGEKQLKRKVPKLKAKVRVIHSFEQSWSSYGSMSREKASIWTPYLPLNRHVQML
jgi:hypothetical protein